MNNKLAETIAVILTIVGVAAAIAGPFWYEHANVYRDVEDGTRVITLTGVASTGIWTEQQVTAENYWRRQFTTAQPVVRVGQTVVLRIKSSDVTHGFYLPELGIGPLVIYPGHVETVRFTPEKAGTYTYYCTKVCGDCHFSMRGVLTVVAEGAELVASEPAEPAEPAEHAESTSTDLCKIGHTPPPTDGQVAYGEYLFKKMQCYTCHGQDGRGGVKNFNFTTTEVPSLRYFAERLSIWEPKDAETILKLLENGENPAALSENPPFDAENYAEFAKQYNTMRDVIQHGLPPAMKDPDGLQPPLVMPMWEQRLDNMQIDAILAYLIKLYPWDE